MKKILNILVVLFAAVTLMSCGTENEPGVVSMYYSSYGDGIDTTQVYEEGFHMHSPWSEHIQYNSRNETRQYTAEVLDKNGTKVTLLVGVNFAVNKSKIGALHLKHGKDYAVNIVDVKAKGAIKDVAGRYTYEELYGDKREILETEIEALLEPDFVDNYLILAFVEVSDVNLPNAIANQIVAKEEQKQKNLKAELMEAEKAFTAKARIAEAEGIKQATILNAQAEAEAIEIKNKALSQSPKYIDLIKAEAQMELSRNIKSLGTNNVFGSETLIMKTLGGN